jgi:adenine-specific DNA-methyltransferase
MARVRRLQLDWMDKDVVPRLEPRILLEDPTKSYHASKKVTNSDIFDNLLIHGDNLLALKALDQTYGGQVNFIYIDPPYNTGSAFEHYDDGMEHSLWLGFMRDRLINLKRLLHPNGVICAQIDDSEGPYLKVLMDEVFGRQNYLVTFYVQVRYPEKTLKTDMLFNKVIEQIHCYSGDFDPEIHREEVNYGLEKFCYAVKELGEPIVTEMGGKRVDIFTADQYKVLDIEPSKEGLKEIWASGTILDGNSSGRFFRDYLTGRVTDDGLGVLYKVYGIGDDGLDYRYFTGPKKATATKGKYYQGVPKSVLEEKNATKKKVISNLMDLAGAFGNCRSEGGVEFRSGKKPEVLLGELIRLTTRPGDLVLDSFAGSGTTGATAHKMGRRWIMVELGPQCETHIVKRLRGVIDGTDKTGITAVMDWKGGGGFRYCQLAPSMLEKDKWGNWIISKQYNAEMLAEAMCQHMGFSYEPSSELYWQHGYSSEKDYIYVTTSNMTHDQLTAISHDVGTEQTLLICCKAWHGKTSDFPNLTLKKIPQVILDKCEWGRDDYSLAIQELEDENEIEDLTDKPEKSGKSVASSKKLGSKGNQLSLQLK